MAEKPHRRPGRKTLGAGENLKRHGAPVYGDDLSRRLGRACILHDGQIVQANRRRFIGGRHGHVHLDDVADNLKHPGISNEIQGHPLTPIHALGLGDTI